MAKRERPTRSQLKQHFNATFIWSIALKKDKTLMRTHLFCDFFPQRKARLLSSILTLCASVTLLPLLHGQALQQDAGPPPYSKDGTAPTGGNPASAVQPSQNIGPDDLLEIEVSYCPELTHRFRVSPDGTLTLPLLKAPIPIAGLTPPQVTTKIKSALETQDVLADPVVTVFVAEYRSRPVSVIGAVVHPLTFQATGTTTLLDAIALAGGLSADAGTNIIVTRKHASPEGVSETTEQTIPVRGLLSHSDIAFNPQLHGDEEIRVEQIGKIFVAGNVRHPGMYPMQSEFDTTVVKALALSEGLAPYSSKFAFIYRRTQGSDPEELKVPLNLIMQRRAPDVKLLADDILYVPENNGKRLTSRVLEQLAGFSQAAGSSLIIYH
jgi:polysaccharide export outer membrane protein